MSNKGINYTRQQALAYTSYNYETSKTMPAAYGVMSGDFDGAGGSYGIIQFNWGSGTLQPIFRDLINQHPADVQAAFTNTADYNYFVDLVLNKTVAEQKAFGTSITNYTQFKADGTPVMDSGHTVKDPWNTYFVKLGTMKSCQDRQQLAANFYLNIANGWCSDFGLWTRRGYALCFDIAVQSQSISTAAHADIMNFVASIQGKYTPEYRELLTMRYLANRRAQDVTSSFHDSYLARKLAIANGSGIVYGYNVDTRPYDLILEPNGLLAIPEGKKPHWIRNIRMKKG